MSENINIFQVDIFKCLILSGQQQKNEQILTFEKLFGIFGW